MRPLFRICLPSVGIYSPHPVARIRWKRGIFRPRLKFHSFLFNYMINNKSIFILLRKHIPRRPICAQVGQQCGEFYRFWWIFAADSAILSP